MNVSVSISMLTRRGTQPLIILTLSLKGKNRKFHEDFILNDEKMKKITKVQLEMWQKQGSIISVDSGNGMLFSEEKDEELEDSSNKEEC